MMSKLLEDIFMLLVVMVFIWSAFYFYDIYQFKQCLDRFPVYEIECSRY